MVPKQVIRQSPLRHSFFFLRVMLSDRVHEMGGRGDMPGQPAQAHPPWLLTQDKCQGQIVLTSRMPWGMFRSFSDPQWLEAKWPCADSQPSVQIWSCIREEYFHLWCLSKENFLLKDDNIFSPSIPECKSWWHDSSASFYSLIEMIVRANRAPCVVLTILFISSCTSESVSRAWGMSTMNNPASLFTFDLPCILAYIKPSIKWWGHEKGINNLYSSCFTGECGRVRESWWYERKVPSHLFTCLFFGNFFR